MLAVAKFLDKQLDRLAIWWLRRRGPVLMNLSIRVPDHETAVRMGPIEGTEHINMPSGRPAYLVNCQFFGGSAHIKM